EHIKEVVAMQQSYAKVSGVFENLQAHRLVEDAIAMNIGAFERHGVEVERRFSAVPAIRVDRHKLLQILINLIRNAKYALDDVERIDKKIVISISAPNERCIQIVVSDNGIGISPENLTRIFAHGFTTREGGHGFGLHSGAIAARSMGGSITVASPGIGQGASFTLELPIASTACVEGAPYAVAFVDVRMPPGWDGIETISRIWKEFPDLQIVICTAYSDYSWDEIAKSVGGNTDKMLVLKKPFDNVEVLQMAHALSKKWQLTQMAREQMEELDALVNQRTAELRAANARLTGEVAERAAADEALR